MTTTSKKTQWKSMSHPDWSEVSESEHFVLFYEADEFLLDSLSGFIGMGLEMGDACIIVATKAHREDLEQRLKAKGLDLAAAQEWDEYISLDADETLSTFMINGSPNPEQFAEVIGDVIMRASKGRQHVRIFGEMVALLWTEGNHAAAFRLEELWNDLRHKTPPFSLLCGYTMHDFAGDVYKVQFTEICQYHSQVISDQSNALLDNPDEHSHTIAPLQPKTNSLKAEVAEHKATKQKGVEIPSETFVSTIIHELKPPLTALQENVHSAQYWLMQLSSQAALLAPEQQSLLEAVLTMLSRSQEELQVLNHLIKEKEAG